MRTFTTAAVKKTDNGEISAGKNPVRREMPVGKDPVSAMMSVVKYEQSVRKG